MDRVNNKQEIYKSLISYSGPILPTKSMITKGPYLYKHPRIIELNDSNLKLLAKFDEKIINNNFRKSYNNNSDLVKECINGNI